jgi:HNH endonuclease
VNIADRFNSKWTPEPYSGCWIWTAAVDRTGYGVIGLGTRKDGIGRAHRVSYQLFKGEIPKGMFVTHSCDTPLCVNPEHLNVATHADNMIEMVNRGRSLTGPRKLKASDVREIRSSHDKNVDLAKRFSVDPSTISYVRRNHTWRFIV